MVGRGAVSSRRRPSATAWSREPQAHPGPIFEADFQPGSYGYRPKRLAHAAVERVAEAIAELEDTGH